MWVIVAVIRNKVLVAGLNVVPARQIAHLGFA
jgi:hypothetical protein